MATLTTAGVKISVSTQFRQDFSALNEGVYFFNYRIDIQNSNEFDIQLLSREWYIFDSLKEASFVRGEGVIGEQPILKPGEKYTYTSGCELSSDIGMMKGFYTFKKLSSDDLFQVFVPTFKLEYPAKLN
ncbi:MAG: Co2+/Mg2+ efflux protein ApaG [Flavobacteriales bacterium]|tara:strand:- start:1113 stop:1499 length:387 start_codon:yes stop_codon:yes gene_type:complete